MVLEHLVVVSALVLAVGLIGVLIRREPLILFSSVIIMSGSLLITFGGFTLFWKNDAGVSAIFIILTLLVAQTLTTLSVLSSKKT